MTIIILTIRLFDFLNRFMFHSSHAKHWLVWNVPVCGYGDRGSFLPRGRSCATVSRNQWTGKHFHSLMAGVGGSFGRRYTGFMGRIIRK